MCLYSAGAQFTPDILALNPMAKVPILIDPEGPARGEPIFESGAILLYLAESYGPDFLPPAGPARYTVLKWLFMQVASMGPALGNHSHFRQMADSNEYAAARFRRMAAQNYRALDVRLSQAPYLGGEPIRLPTWRPGPGRAIFTGTACRTRTARI